MLNEGMSFGLNFPGLVVIGGIVWLGLVIWWWKKRGVGPACRQAGLGLIVLGGGLNLLERILKGYVSDYWKIPGVNLYNNLNDWLIFIGAVGWLIWK